MIRVLSEQEFRVEPITNHDIVISIVSPGREHPRLSVDCLARLNLHFKDTMRYEVHEQGFSDAQAVEVADFVEKWLLDSDRIVIHCEAGMSRSAGIAVGLARYLLTDEDEKQVRDKKPHFNLDVAQKIWRVYQKRF
jgi:predicted protein tyrosine phosphatase